MVTGFRINLVPGMPFARFDGSCEVLGPPDEEQCPCFTVTELANEIERIQSLDGDIKVEECAYSWVDRVQLELIRDHEGLHTLIAMAEGDVQTAGQCLY